MVGGGGGGGELEMAAAVTVVFVLRLISCASPAVYVEKVR
jgi:hypothetical protein